MVVDLATGISLIGLAVAIGGLVVALSQLDRTATAVEAAEAAANRTERDAATRNLLVLVPSLEQAEMALDAAVAAKQFAVARRELAAWRARASEIKGLFTHRSDVDEQLRRNLDTALTQVASAKRRLF